MNNLNENQVINVNNIRSSDEIVSSNVSVLINDQNNQDMYKNWCEEDGDFEVDELVQQQQGDHREIQPPQQSTQLELVRDDGNFDFDEEMINSGQNNNDQTTTTTNNNVLGGQKQNDDEEVEALQSSSTTKNNQDVTLQFDEDLDDMMTDEIGKNNNGNLCTAQNNEVPVQSVLIDLKDVVTLEDEIIKSQSPEKVQKSKQSPQKGKQKKSAKKTKVDTEMLASAAEDSKSSPIKSKNDQVDQADLSASENDPKTKSGRKVQRPKFFNHTVFKYGRRKSSFDPNDNLKKTYRKLAGKRQPKSAKNKGKDANVSQESENGSSEKQLENSQALVQLQTTNGPILYDPNNPSTIYVDPEDDNMLCAACHDGTSEKQNWIVLCDKCDVPYHQQCHKPRIEDSVAEDSQSEWICSKCKNSSRLSKRIKVDKEIQEDKEQDQDLISIGTVLTREQKVEYLSSLSIDVLVNLLLLAEQMEPNIPLYPANILGKYATTNMSSKDNEMDETDQSIQDAGECLAVAVDVPTSGLSTADVSNLSTLDVSPNLNPVNVEKVEKGPSNIPEQDSQQEPITPESSPPSNSLKEIAEHNKDSYLNLYIRAMSEIGNPNGSTAQTMHAWIKSNYNVPDNFSARAKKALHFAVHNGIFVKNSRMTYKFNPEYTYSYDKTVNNELTTANTAKNAEVNVNNNNTNYGGQKSNYKELTTGLQGGEEISGVGKQNSSSEIKDFNFYPNQEFYLDSMLDANFLGKSDDTYTATSTSKRSSLSNVDNNNNNNVESNNNNNNNNNVPVTDQYNQTLSSSDKQPPPPPQSQPISRIPKLSVNAQMMMNNEQPRTDIRLPPLAPKPPINVLPSIMRSNSINYQPSQHQNELLTSSIGGGGNDFSYSLFQQPLILPKNQILPLPRVNNNDNDITRNITTTTKIQSPSIISTNYSILTPPVVRGGNQLPQQPQQIYDTKVRTPASSIPSLQPLPAIDNSLNGNVGKIRPPQLIPLQSSTMHNTATTMSTSPPQQTWPSSFNPFYMTPQPGESQFTTIFDNTFYDPTQPPQQHHHHSSTTSTNDYNNVVINDLQQQHNDNSTLFHRIGGSQQQQDNNILGEWEYRNP